MSPTKIQEGETRRVINGPRPFPLRINKDSSMIQKPSFSTNVFGHDLGGQKLQNSIVQKRQPVIIYTHSPKVIHAQARDFRALVQKLTGLTSSKNDTAEAECKKNDKSSTSQEKNDFKIVKEETEKYGIDKQSLSSISPMNKVYNPYLADIPLFTPSSSDFLFSSWPRLFQSPSMASSMSPRILELMKGLPEY
ncbi:VQ motif-containing protein 8, chloroplastic-like [Olea europaea var. sylvestris]|uniref:VQ motif-containing protein 8, chloroplastic-like n=1 Tax=Olea europaea var. sylvestris TaxID=158386 RepID=UPI000C1D0ED4|nr:VQ motif-containing protein 8, chloroplastic-like [Olea europaea var. sylvestris]